MVDYKLITKRVVTYTHLNNHGNLYGGFILFWLDEAGYIFASESCNTTSLVTVYLNNLKFKAPGKCGDIIRIFGKVKSKGNTSITILLKAERCSSNNCNKQIITECEMVFVKIDENGNPVKI